MGSNVMAILAAVLAFIMVGGVGLALAGGGGSSSKTVKRAQAITGGGPRTSNRKAVAADPVEFDLADADRLNHKNRKIDWIWWTAAAHLLQMADAYVDAHFVNFDAEFGPDDDRSSSRGAPRLRLSLTTRF